MKFIYNTNFLEFDLFTLIRDINTYALALKDFPRVHPHIYTLYSIRSVLSTPLAFTMADFFRTKYFIIQDC